MRRGKVDRATSRILEQPVVPVFVRAALAAARRSEAALGVVARRSNNKVHKLVVACDNARRLYSHVLACCVNVVGECPSDEDDAVAGPSPVALPDGAAAAGSGGGEGGGGEQQQRQRQLPRGSAIEDAARHGYPLAKVADNLLLRLKDFKLLDVHGADVAYEQGWTPLGDALLIICVLRMGRGARNSCKAIGMRVRCSRLVLLLTLCAPGSGGQ